MLEGREPKTLHPLLRLHRLRRRVIRGDDEIQPKSSDEDFAFITAEDLHHRRGHSSPPKTFVIVKDRRQSLTGVYHHVYVVLLGVRALFSICFVPLGFWMEFLARRMSGRS